MQLEEIVSKRVLIRFDYNVPMEDGSIVNDFRIRQTYGTIFNLIPETKKYKDIYEKGGSLIQFLLFHTFLWIPLILLYRHYNKIKGYN